MRSFLGSILGKNFVLPSLTELEKLLHNGDPCIFISKVYSVLIKECPKPKLYRSKERWESDLNITIEDALWSDLCKDSISATINSRYRLIHYNFLHQLYLTPEKIHGSKPELSEVCFRCATEIGSFLHCTWSCVKVRDYWLDLCDTLSNITRISIPVEPEICLIGNFMKINEPLNKYQTKFLEIALAVAKKNIAVTWKSDSPLHLTKWYTEMNRCIPLEKITYSLRKSYKTFVKIWQPYLDYVGAVVI